MLLGMSCCQISAQTLLHVAGNVLLSDRSKDSSACCWECPAVRSQKRQFCLLLGVSCCQISAKTVLLIAGSVLLSDLSTDTYSCSAFYQKFTVICLNQIGILHWKLILLFVIPVSVTVTVVPLNHKHWDCALYWAVLRYDWHLFQFPHLHVTPQSSLCCVHTGFLGRRAGKWCCLLPYPSHSTSEMWHCSHKNIPQLLHEWFPLAGMSIPYIYSAMQYVSACRYCYWQWTVNSSFGILSNSLPTNHVVLAQECTQASASWGQQMSVNCLVVYVYLYLRCSLYFRCSDGGTPRNSCVYWGRQGYLLLFETKCTSSVLFPTNCHLFYNFILFLFKLCFCFS